MPDGENAMVAIILVNFNGASDTIECIASLERCTYKDHITIVVDNCSTDDSVQKLQKANKKYRFVLLEANENRGFASGNNIGIKYAIKKRTEYFLLLNNDTLVKPDFLERLLDGFHHSKMCGATVGKIYYEDQRDIIWYAGGSLDFRTARTEHWEFGKKEISNKEETKKVTFATGCCLCISNKLIDSIGLLDESYFLYEEDTEYCYRIMQAGYDIIYVPSAVIYHKVSNSTGLRSPLSQYYTIRNKYIMIRQHFIGINKTTAYIYSTLQMLFRCIKGELSLKYYFMALKAFIKKEIGKAEDLII